MTLPRTSGTLLHPSSLPGRFGIGEIGPEAIAFVDQLHVMGQGIWQVLPLGPTSFGDSPYQSPSVFAGNPLLISLDWLCEDGLLSEDSLDSLPPFDPEYIDFAQVINTRQKLYAEVADRFTSRASKEILHHLEEFQFLHGKNWLDDYALFAALKQAHADRPWTQWESELAHRDPCALNQARNRLAGEIRQIKIQQYLFSRHWGRLRKHSESLGIRIFGDIAIFVAHDSADVWAHRDLFYLDEQGYPSMVAGVPPDYFSATGQRWGNPLYRWDRMAANGFGWWEKRLRRTFEKVDIVRLDHFRGFESCWAIPHDQPTAEQGRWLPGPGHEFFEAMQSVFGELPIVAEDLGFITEQVRALRDCFGFPGMRILQFAFGKDPTAESFLPENYIPNCVCYTGTHDNDTIVGWFHGKECESSTRKAEDIEREKRAVCDYIHTDGTDIHWDFIELAMRSVANTVIIPLQDMLGLGSEARLNTPGQPTGNWRWRFKADLLTLEINQKMRQLTEESGRTQATGGGHLDSAIHESQQPSRRKSDVTKQKSKALVRRWNEQIWLGNQDIFVELLAPNCIFHGMGGVWEIKQTVQHILGAFPDIRITIDDQIAEGNKVVTRWTLRGTHQGEVWGVPATGIPVSYTGISINHVVDGRITEEWCELDLLGVMRQIGAGPPFGGIYTDSQRNTGK